MDSSLILVINPGSMTTKLSLFEGESEKFFEEVEHPEHELAACRSFLEQLPIRLKAVLEFLDRHDARGRLRALACRGAPLLPLEAGTYRVNEDMVDDLTHMRIHSPHISMLAALIGWDLSKSEGAPAFITDPVSVDEFSPIARISGLPEIPRRSLWHALNCRAVARRYGDDSRRAFTDMNLIVVHLGSGITVASFERGRTVDSTDANSESCFAPQRAGTLRMIEFADLCYSGAYTRDRMIKMITSQAGLKSHLGTNDAREIERRIEGGDEKARIIYEAMAYGVCKQIGAMAAVLKGHVDAILLTGSLSRSEMICRWIEERVSFIAQVKLYPGQEEMKALALGTLRVLEGREQEKVYRSKERVDV